jgi:hypothetical protein
MSYIVCFAMLIAYPIERPTDKPQVCKIMAIAAPTKIEHSRATTIAVRRLTLLPIFIGVYTTHLSVLVRI